MAQFNEQNQPTSNKGRPRGSKNVRGKLSTSVTAEAMRQLESAVFVGEQWALIEVLKRLSPTLKAVTPPDSLDGDYLSLKMKSLSEFEARIAELEAKTK
jgi:hypothetical protein